jgi:hypothetical protein
VDINTKAFHSIKRPLPMKPASDNLHISTVSSIYMNRAK